MMEFTNTEREGVLMSAESANARACNVWPTFRYRDAKAAIAFLQEALGFEVVAEYTNADDPMPGVGHLGAGAIRIIERAHEYVVDGGETSGPFGLEVDSLVQFRGQRPRDSSDVDTVMGELCGGDSEECARGRRAEVDLDSGHRAGVRDERRAQVEAGEQYVEMLTAARDRVDLTQRFIDRHDEGQRSRGQSQMRPRGDAGDVVAGVIAHERPQSRVRPADQLVIARRGHGVSVDLAQPCG